MNIQQQLHHAATLLGSDRLVAIPTETVYGLGGAADSKIAVQKIFDVKGRPATNPLIVHLSQWEAIHDWANNIPKEAQILAKTFWPGPLTLVLEKQNHVLEAVTAGQNTVALRVPNHPITLELLKIFKRGIAAPSANRSGRISPTTPEHVRAELGTAVDFILEGGPCQVGIESTIVSLLNDDIQILRQGKITQTDIEKCIGKPVKIHSLQNFDDHTQTNIVVPGSGLSHYAPIHPLFLVDSQSFENTLKTLHEQHTSIAVLSFLDKESVLEKNITLQLSHNIVGWMQASKNPELFARTLYAYLRQLDALNPSCIVVETPESTQEWSAVRDRLYRASQK